MKRKRLYADDSLIVLVRTICGDLLKENLNLFCKWKRDMGVVSHNHLIWSRRSTAYLGGRGG